MRIVLAAAVLALLAGPAFAQNDDHVPRYGEEDKEKTPEQKRGEKAAQDAYQRRSATSLLLQQLYCTSTSFSSDASSARRRGADAPTVPFAGVGESAGAF